MIRNWVRRAVLIGIVACGGGAAARAGDDAAPAFDPADASVLREPAKDPEGVARLLARAKAFARSPRAAAEALRASGVEVEGSVGVKAETVLGLEAATAAGNAGGSWSLGWRDMKWKGGAGANDRTITNAVELTTAVAPDGTRLKRVYQVGLVYPDNRSYLEAMGIDARSLPGMQTTLKVMRAALETAPVETGEKTAPPTVLDAVGKALYEELPAIFRSATKFTQFEVRSGWMVEDPTGRVSVTHVEVERRDAGETPGEPRRWEEVSAGLDLDRAIPAGAVAVAGTLSLAAKWSPGKPADDPDPRQRALADAMERGDAEIVAEALKARLAPVTDPARVRAAIEALEKAGTAAAGELGRVVGLRGPPEVGGVSLHYDPGLLATAVPPDDAVRTLDRMLDGIAKSPEGFVVRGLAGRMRLEAVSLRALLDDPAATTVGPLERLRGIVVDASGDVVLLGERGDAPIDLDVLTVAARTIGRDGTFPYVSLDPDPDDFAGPQRTRVGGLPDGLRDTAFVKTMLEADYAMKRITLGVDRPGVEGFRSWHDLIAATPPASGATAASRSWLVPMTSRVADAWTFERGGRRVWLFDARVQVLSEEMKRVADLLVGTGDADPLAAEAAGEFTRCYDALAERRPVFRALAGLFDASKLFALLRRDRVAHPLLDRLAARTPRRVEVAASYDGVGPVPVAGTTIALSGGAEARVRVRARDVRASADLAPLLDARGGGDVAVTFPTTVPLSGRDALAERAEVQFHRAVALLADDRVDDADALLDRALEDDPENPGARVLRAVAAVGRGDLDRALADVDAAIGEVPEALGMRGLLRVLRGDLDGGKADTEEALRRFPDDEATLGWGSEARLLLADFAGAEDLLSRSLAIDTTDAAARMQWTQLDVLHRMGPTAARARVALLRRVPYAILAKYFEGAAALLSLDVARAVALLEQARTRVLAAEGAPGVAEFHLRDRIEAVLASALAGAASLPPPMRPTSSLSARALLDEMVARHPDWTTPRLLLLSDPAVMDGQAAEATLERILASAGDDPLMDDFATLFGAGRAKAWAAVTIWRRVIQRGVSDVRLAPVLERVAEACGDGYEASLLRAMQAGLHREQGAVLPLGERLCAMPVPLSNDPTTLLATCTAMQLYLQAPVADAARAQRVAVLRRFLRATDVDELHPSLWPVLSQLRLGAAVALGESLAAADPASSRFEAARVALVNRRLDVAGARAAVTAAYDDVRRDLATDLTPFVAEMAAYIFRAHLPMDALYAAARSGARLDADGATRDRIDGEVAAWADDEAKALAALRGPDRALELVERARRPSDVRMLSTVADLLGVVAQLSDGTADAGKVAATQAKLAARVRGMSAPITRRDWVAWRDPAASPTAPRDGGPVPPTRGPVAGVRPGLAVPEGGSPSGTSDGFGPSPVLVAAAVGGVFAAIAVVLVARARARRRAGDQSKR
ncbi:MAG: hypothetical protein U1E39_15870 [Planctomycetota bacterium]